MDGSYQLLGSIKANATTIANPRMYKMWENNLPTKAKMASQFIKTKMHNLLKKTGRKNTMQI